MNSSSTGFVVWKDRPTASTSAIKAGENRPEGLLGQHDEQLARPDLLRPSELGVKGPQERIALKIALQRLQRDPHLRIKAQGEGDKTLEA